MTFRSASAPRFEIPGVVFSSGALYIDAGNQWCGSALVFLCGSKSTLHKNYTKNKRENSENIELM